MPPDFSHLDAEGTARMVDVGAKPVQRRKAVAAGFVECTMIKNGGASPARATPDGCGKSSTHTITRASRARIDPPQKYMVVLAKKANQRRVSVATGRPPLSSDASPAVPTM